MRADGGPASALAVSCPVCLYPASGQHACLQCGWTLTDGPWMGHATAEHRRRFDDRLSAARRGVDVRAAVLAAGFPGDGDLGLLDRLAELVRGGTAQQPEIDAARGPLGAVPATPEHTLIAETVAAALARLVAEPDRAAPGSEVSRLTLVELGADRITTAVLATDELGTPYPVTPMRSVGWRELLPALPADPGEARFVLAGGVGTTSRAVPVTGGDLAALATDPRVLPQPTGEPGEVVLLNRVSAWPVPDRLVQRYREVTAPGGAAPLRRCEVRLSALGPSLDDGLLVTLISLAPLRLGYGLVLAAVDVHTGAVQPVVHRLFEPGATARDTPSAIVPVLAPATDGQPVILAVVAGHPGAGPQHCRPVSIVRARLRSGRTHQIEIGLDAPARVVVRRPPERVPEQITGSPEGYWHELLSRLPAVYHWRTLALDLAFAVELGGQPPATVTRRLALVDETIRLIDSKHPEPEAVRFAIIGYADHRGTDDVVTVQDFAPAATGLGFLPTLYPGQQHSPYAAPVEDALHAAAYQLHWRPTQVARVLVIIGGRQPHPTEPGSVPACPNRYAWHRLLDRFDKEGVHRIAVWDQPSWCTPQSRNLRDSRATQDAWAALGKGRRPRLDQVDAMRLSVAAGALPAKESGDALLFPIVTTSTGTGTGRRPLREDHR